VIIIVNNWKKKVLKILTLLVLLLAFAVAVPALTGALYKQIPVLNNWFQGEEHPTGNPLRVEQEQNTSQFERVVDQLVIKLQDFYYDK